MPDPLVAILVSVPDDHFADDDDDLSLAAGNFVCQRLETHLLQHGHTIDDWIRGGCDEDWGVYLESQLGNETFAYHICFFPDMSNDGQKQMVIQYHLKTPLLKRLFFKPPELAEDHPLHATMRAFGETFDSSRTLTQSEFDQTY